MRAWFRESVLIAPFAFVLIVGCGGSGGPGAPGDVPICKNPTAQMLSCNSCDVTNCPSQASSVVSACAEYLSCYEACDCADAACVNACPKSDSCVEAAFAAFAACTTCTQACISITVTLPDGGGNG